MQTLGVLATALLLALAAFDTADVKWLLIIGGALALWQCVTYLLFKSDHYGKSGAKYLRLLSLYFILATSVSFATEIDATRLRGHLVALVSPGLSIVGYYYTLTVRHFFQKNSGRGFLPHLGF